MMCALGEFWWIFSIICVLSVFVIIMAPTDAQKTGLVSGAICLLSIALLAVAGGAKDAPGCKELRYRAVLDRRPELVRECPDREDPGCQLKWIRYQKDSLSRYLQVLQ